MQNKMFYVILIVATLFIDTLGQFGGFKPMTKYKNDLNESNIGSNLIDYKFREIRGGELPCSSDGLPDVAKLIEYVSNNHMSAYTPVIFFDEFYSNNANIHEILKFLQGQNKNPIRYGKIVNTSQIATQLFKPEPNKQLSFFMMVKNLDLASEIMETYVTSSTKIVIISDATKFHIDTFLASSTSRLYPNLVIFEDPTIQRVLFGEELKRKVGQECDINLYTHEMFIDSLGSSKSVILTAWRKDQLTRRHVELFPNKLKNGLNGLHLIISAAETPPFVFRRRGQDSGEGYTITKWEGIEVRLIKTLSEMLGFTYEFIEPDDSGQDGADRVLNVVNADKANIGIGGIYYTEERNKMFSLSLPHTHDCAAFISLASTALPKYRAIMGPFLWDVWLALTAIYILAIFPIAFSVWHSIKPLLENWMECENMFWYVFGTFTNCFTFTGKNSWSHTQNISTRIFIGSYWAFTIIITAAYTGSLITFITIPEMPEVIDTPQQILQQDFQISTLDSGGWVNGLKWAEDATGKELYKRHYTVPDITTGLHNVTQSLKSRKPTAFLGSKEHLDYTVRTNFTSSLEIKKTVFHTSRVCFSPLLVSLAFPKITLFREEINLALIKAIQVGFMTKITNEVHWQMYKSSTGKFLHSCSKSMLKKQDEQLTLDDTSGMFLLLGAGFFLAVLALIFEIISWMMRDITHRNVDQLTIKSRIHNYCVFHYKKFKAVVLSPGEDYKEQQQAYIWQYICNHAKKRLSKVGWSLFGSPVRQSQHSSPHKIPLPHISVTRNSF